MGTLRMPDGRAYSTGQTPVTTAADHAADVRTTAALTRAGAAVVKEAAAREAVAKELDAAAERWLAKSENRNTSVRSDIQQYYYDKAQSARARAQEIRSKK